MKSLLKIDSLCVSFGGLKAVDNVSLAIRPGDVHGLIGPNGAGKTTLFNAISGLVRAGGGAMFLEDKEITAMSPPLRAAQGIRRTFQTVQLVQSFNVYENLLLGLHSSVKSPLTSFLIGHPVEQAARFDTDADIDRVLRYLNISDLREKTVSSLTIAQQRYVEIGQAIISRPKLLMLDEPTAGLSPMQIDRLDSLIAQLPADWNVSIVLVEHVIPLVVKLCNRITVLDQGRVIAEGSGLEIKESPAVRKAYLGERLSA